MKKIWHFLCSDLSPLGPSPIVVILLIVLALQCVMSMRVKSPVCDEVSHHIGMGYSFLKTRDFRLNSTSPPLTEELAALPLLALNPKLPLQHPSWKNIDRVTFGYEFLFRANKTADQLVFWSRVPMVALSVLCGLLVFIFAKELYGRGAGLFALFLYSFSPNIIAYSRLVTPDIGASFLILFAIYRYYKFLRKHTWKNVIFAGIALGLALTSKLSALLLIPVFLIIILWKVIESRGMRLRYLDSFVLIFIICAATIFTVYLGEVKPLLENDIDVHEKIAYLDKGVDKIFGPDSNRTKEKVIEFALNVPVPFATYLMNILSETNMVFVKDYGTYLFGKRSNRGWWYYYIFVFLLKTPIVTLLLIALSILLGIGLKAKERWAVRILIIFLAGFIAASLMTRLQLSVRYLLPIYPIIFILISRIASVKIKKQLLLSAALIIFGIWYAVEALAIYPNYISYFNQFAGGADNGWRSLRDSNIDYGQDLPLLAAYLKKNNIKKIKLSYFGTADPKYYGIKYNSLTEADQIEPSREVYAISANHIDGVEWADKNKPDAKAGYSIFIYDFRNKKI
ncbi:ArnT family glycosyltransferase [Candidatus Omnitrophota bacterium]